MMPTQLLRTNATQRTFALLIVATMAAVPSFAANRAPRLHAASHPVGHVVATRTEAAREHEHRAAHVQVVEARPSKHGKNSSSGKVPLAAAKSHTKDSRRRHREPEIVDEPVVMHRASAHGHVLTRRERQEEMAEASYEAARYDAARRAHLVSHAHKTFEAPVREVATREPESSASRYASREYAASYDNVSRAVDQATRPNAYARREGDTQIGTALRSDTTPENHPSAPTADPIADEARRSSVVVRRALSPAQIAAIDAPPNPVQHYQPRVATGFGAEVAPLPSSAHQRNAPGDAALANEAQDLGEDLAADGVPSARTLANDAMQPLVTPMYTRDGSLMMPAPLKGSHEILVHQNLMADHDGLERIRDDIQLNRLRAQRELVSFPESLGLRVNEGLPENRRYARPWTVQFAADAARAFYQHFGEPLQVNSAVRTVSYQARLQRVNGNAAATSGEAASPHLTGQAIDLAKRGMTADQIAWMRTYLLPFIDAGKVDVEEEFQQACFHISVYRSYLPAVRRQTFQVAQIRSLPPTPATTLRETPDANQ